MTRGFSPSRGIGFVRMGRTQEVIELAQQALQMDQIGCG